MNKFIIGTFAILGWAFYALSGGADFEPQARMAAADRIAANETPTVPVATEVVAAAQPAGVEATPALSETDPVATRAETASLGQLTDTPATVVPATQPLEQELATAPRTPGSQSTSSGEPLFASLSGSDASGGLPSIREVSARAVNMREGPGTTFAVIDTLTQGTEAEVMASDGTGWVRVFIPQTGMTGWMAERLLTEG